MSNILDYIDWRGDLSMSDSPFCAVDALIFSKLIYANLSGCAPEDFCGSVTLSECYDRYLGLGGGPNGRAGDPFPLFVKAAGSRRFGEVRLCGYRAVFDEEKTVQFGAAAFLLPDRAFIAFRGTDDSFVGWREDMELCFADKTEGQKEAAIYTAEASKELRLPLWLGGHSKGGNLAAYAAAALAGAGIDGVCSFDGPGAGERRAQTEGYAAVRDRIFKYIPESSIVGVLFPDGCAQTVVRSDGRGFGQHNVYTWQVLGRDFEFADERSAVSVFADETVRRWMASMDEDGRRTALCAIFDAIEASGCKTFAELKKKKRVSYNAILKAVTKADPKRRKEVVRALKEMAKSSGEVLYNSAKRTFEKSGAIHKIKSLRLPAGKKEKEKNEKTE